MKYRDFLVPVLEGIFDITSNATTNIAESPDMSENDCMKIKNYLLALNTVGLMGTLSDMANGDVDEMMEMFEESTKHAVGEEDYETHFKVEHMRDFAKAWIKLVLINDEMDEMLSTVAESVTFADFLDDADNMNDLLDMRNDIDNKLRIISE